MAHCIYCEKSTKLSREHVFPKFLLNAHDKRGLFYSNSAGRYFDSDAQVKDTCIPCNSGQLSLLDSYVKTLHANYFTHVIIDSKSVTFEFDKLLRWVLKVTFNAQRGFAGISKPYLHLRKYMLGEAERPASVIFLGVVMKRSWVDEKWKTPRDFRACDIRIPELELQVEIKFCNMLVINSFCFLVADIIDSTPERHERVTQFLCNLVGAKEIAPGTKSFEFDSIASKIDHVSHNIAQSAINPKAFPKNMEVVGKKTIRLTGLPEGYPIQRARVQYTKVALVSLPDENEKYSACIVFFQFPQSLHEFDQSIENSNHKTSTQCFASINRGGNKTYVTLHDPNELNIPHFSNSIGIEQSKENWERFNFAIARKGCLFLADNSILDGSTTVFNCIKVISIETV